MCLCKLMKTKQFDSPYAPLSSGVEHQSRKLGVVGSNPTGGRYFLGTPQKNLPKSTQLAGFEPTRAEPIGFQVQRLNHSATTAI